MRQLPQHNRGYKLPISCLALNIFY